MQDIFEHLRAEHRKIESLLRKLEGSSLEERQKTFKNLKADLLAHMNAEEERFYPALQQKNKLRRLVEGSKQEHQRVEKALWKLEKSSGVEWFGAIRELKEELSEHIRKEEEEIFPIAENEFSEEEAKVMCREYEDVEESYKKKIA